MSARECQVCGSSLELVRDRELTSHRHPSRLQTIEIYRCSNCREGGEILKNSDGSIQTRRGPATDPTFRSPRPPETEDDLIADGGINE